MEPILNENNSITIGNRKISRQNSFYWIVLKSLFISHIIEFLVCLVNLLIDSVMDIVVRDNAIRIYNFLLDDLVIFFSPLKSVLHFIY